MITNELRERVAFAILTNATHGEEFDRHTEQAYRQADAVLALDELRAETERERERIKNEVRHWQGEAADLRSEVANLERVMGEDGKRIANVIALTRLMLDSGDLTPYAKLKIEQALGLDL